MSLIKPISKRKVKSLKLNIDEKLLTRIEKYCNWAKVEKVEQFFEQAAEYILKKDSAFKKLEEGKTTE